MAVVPQESSGAHRRFRVTVRVALVRKNLSAADATEYTDADVRQWLADAGFESAGGDEFLVDEPNLGHLDPSEVADVTPADG